MITRVKSAGQALSGSMTVRSLSLITKVVSSPKENTFWPVITGGSFTAIMVAVRIKILLVRVPSLTVTGIYNVPENSGSGMTVVSITE
jgi:hypothetical protein